MNKTFNTTKAHTVPPPQNESFVVVARTARTAPRTRDLRLVFGVVGVFLLCYAFFFTHTPLASAEEFVVDPSIFATNSNGLTGAPAAVCVSELTCFVFYLASAGDIDMASTTDGGVTWSSGRRVDSINTADAVSVGIWWEGWTPGTTSTRYIHIATTDTGVDDTYYTRYDIETNTLSTTVLATTQAAACGRGADCYPTITMTATGTLYIATAEDTDRWVVRCNTTCTTAGNWGEIAGGFQGANGDDYSILMPIPGTDNVLLTWWDISSDQIFWSIFSATSSSWSTFSLVMIGPDDNTTYDAQLMGMAIATTTGQIALTFVDDANDYTTADHDIKFYLYSSSTGWAEKTNPVTNATGTLTGAKVAYDAANATWYVVYVRRGFIGTTNTGARIFYLYSTDGGDTWSAEQGPINDYADDINALTVNITSHNRLGVWWNYSTAPRADQLFYTPLAAMNTSATVSGTLYESNRTTAITTGETVTLAIGTSTLSTHSTTTDGSGNFSFTLPIKDPRTHRIPLTLYVDDDATLKGAAVTPIRNMSTTLSNVPLSRDHVSVVAPPVQQSITPSLTDFQGYDSTDDADVQFTASSTIGRLTVAGGQTFYIASGTTAHLDLPLEGDDFETATTAVARASSTLALSGNFTQNGAFRSAATTTWTDRNVTSAKAWRSVTYGNGLFVAVNYNGSATAAVMTSPDGITWTDRNVTSAKAWMGVTYGNGLFVAVNFNNSATAAVMTSPDGITWTDRNVTSAKSWQSVTYGNGLFVAVNQSGSATAAVMTSPDGITWTDRNVTSAKSWYGVTYGNGLFVAVNDSGSATAAVMTSPDGITWTDRNVTSAKSWSSVTYGNGLFVAVNYNGSATAAVMTSPDGITWTDRNVTSAKLWMGVTYGNGLFVAVNTSGSATAAVMTSPEDFRLTLNGTTAQTLTGTLVATSSLPGLNFVNVGTKTFTANASTTDFIIASTSGAVTAATALTLTGNLQNASTLTAPTNLYLTGNNQTATGTFTGTSALNNLHLTGAGLKTFYTNASTTDVRIATDVTVNTPAELTVAGNYANSGTTTKGAWNWTGRTSAADNTWTSVTYGNGLFVAVSATTSTSTAVMTSPDAISWTSQTAASNNSWNSVTYGNGLFVAVSSSGTGNRVMTSPDGVTWTSRTSASDTFWYSVTYGNGLFVAAATTNIVMTSPDGITWTSRAPAADNQWQSVTYGNGLFVAVSSDGTGNRVMTSPDGITWTSRAPAADNQWESVTYGNGLFVAVSYSGTGNRVMTSPDGITWTSQTSAADNSWNSVTYGNGLFVAVSSSGTGNRVMTSLVGTTTFAGASAQSIGGSLTGASALGNVVMTGAGTKTFSANASTSNFVVESGATAVAPAALTIIGNYTNNGTSTAGTGRLTLAGEGNQIATGTLTGTSALYNLTIKNNQGTTTFGAPLTVTNALTAITPGSIIAFAADATTTVKDVTLTGALNNHIKLESTVPGTQAHFVRTGSSSILYTTVTDNDACGSTGGGITVLAAYNTNGGNTTCWSFTGFVGDGDTLTISGVLYGTDRVTPVATPQTVSVAVVTDSINKYSTTTAATTGTFTIVTPIAGTGTSTPLTVFVDGNAALRAVTVTKRTGSTTIPYVPLYQNSVTAHNPNDPSVGTTTRATDFFGYDSTNDADVQFTASEDIGRLTVAGGQTLYVNATTTFHMDVPIVTHSFETATTAIALASSTMTLTGNFTQNGTYQSADPTWTSRTSAADNWWKSVTYGNGLFVAVSANGTGNRVMTSPDGIIWTSQISAVDSDWESVTYGNGLFIAVAQDGFDNRVMTSPDGITWTAYSAADDDDGWSSVTYGNGLFVAVAECGNYGGDCVMTSPDGITWTVQTAAGGNDDIWRGVSYGNGIFVAVGSTYDTDYVMTSPDGITWTSRSPAANNSWSSVTYGNGLFVAVSQTGTGNRVMTSPDGITWTSRPSVTDVPWGSVTYGSGLFVAVSCGESFCGDGMRNFVMTSPDGITWSSQTSPTDNDWYGVAYGNGLFVAVAYTGTGNRVMTSPGDFELTFSGTSAQTITGTLVATSTLPSLNFAAAGTKTFTANASTTDFTIATTSGTVTGGAALTMTGNLQNDSTFIAPTNLYFTGTNQTATGTLTATSTLNNLHLTGAGTKTFYTNASTSDLTIAADVTVLSPADLTVAGNYTNNGTTTNSAWRWTDRNVPSAKYWQSVTYGNGLFVAVNASLSATAAVMTSPDGITWTNRNVTSAKLWMGVTYGNGLFVAVNNNGSATAAVMTSPDGITWTDRNVTSGRSWQSVTYGNGLFVAVNNDDSATAAVMTSPDGITWTDRNVTSAKAWRSVTYGNGLFVAVNSSDSATAAVMTSPDGITWTDRNVTSAKQWVSVTYGSGLFVAVNQSNSATAAVMTSSDGITWTDRDVTSVRKWRGVTYGNGLFVAVNYSLSATAAVMTSPDGITWTDRNVTSAKLWMGVTYGNGLFVAVNNDGSATAAVMTSPVSTTTFSGASAQSISGSLVGASALGNVAFTGAGTKTFSANASTSNFVVGAGATAVAPAELSVFGNLTNSGTLDADSTTLTFHTAVNTTQVATGTLSGASAVGEVKVVGEGRFIPPSTLETTGDLTLAASTTYLARPGSSWTARSAAEARAWQSVAYGNGRFVAVACGSANACNTTVANRVMYSDDGLTWTAVAAASSNDSWYSVTYGKGLFVAVGGNGDRIMTSPDGITWTAQTAPESNMWVSVTYGGGRFVAVACGISATTCNTTAGGNRIMYSDDGVTWATTTHPVANQWRSIAYGNGRFVAVSYTGTGNRAMYSTDGISWLAGTSAADNAWISVAYGNGSFVAVACGTSATSCNTTATGNRVMHSLDGATWTSVNVTNSGWYGVTYGDGRFVAVAYQGTHRLITSEDGLTWTVEGQGVDTSSMWQGVTFGGDRFVAVAYDGTNRVLVSRTATTSFAGTSAQSIVGDFTGVSALGNTAFSGAGTKNFTQNASTSNFVITGGTVTAPSVLSVRGRYENTAGTFGAGAGTLRLDSELPQTATGTMTGTSAFTTLELVGGEKAFYTPVTTDDFVVAANTSVLLPSDLTVKDDYTNNGTTTNNAWNWTSRASAINNSWSSVTYGNGLFVAVSATTSTSTAVMTSPDGITWTSQIAASNNAWESVTYGNGLFVAVASTGSGNRVMTSPDGITWTSQTSAADNRWNSVTYGNGLFVAVACGQNSCFDQVTASLIMTSPDGETWVLQTGVIATWRSVTYGNGRFVAFSSDNEDIALVSFDGIDWNPYSINGLYNNWNSVTYGNGLFVAISGNDVVTSPDGITWTSQTSVANNNWNSVIYGNGLFVAVGYDSDLAKRSVMISPDGVTWTSRTSAADNWWSSVTYGNGRFVAVSSSGTGNRVMYSTVSTTTFSGASAQSIGGSLTGASAFGNVALTGAGTKTFANAASTTNLTLLTTATTTFQDSLSVAEHLAIPTPGAALVLPAATTTRVGSATITGAGGSEVKLRSTEPDTQSNFQIAGAYDITYADIKDSSGTSTLTGLIAVNDGTSLDSGNNDGWDFTVVVSSDPTLSSATNQVFALNQATTTIADITVTDAATSTITAANNIRLTLATTSVAMLWDTTDTTASFSGTAAAKVSTTVSYEGDGATLVLDVTENFAGGDTLTISGLSYTNFTAVNTATTALSLHIDGNATGTPAATDDKTVTITGSLTLTNHPAGQADDGFTMPTNNDVVLYRYTLTSAGEDSAVTDTVITLVGVRGIEAADITNLRLYRDENSDGLYSDGETLIDGSGTPTVADYQGTITFTTDYTVIGTDSFLVLANVADTRPGDMLTLTTVSLTATGTTTNAVLTPGGSISSIQHMRGGVGGSSPIGGDAPPGHSIETGGGQDGGSEIDTNTNGDVLGNLPSFKAPSGESGSWTTGTNGIDSDGSYATTSSLASHTYHSFGFTLPGNSIITGVEVKLEASATSNAGDIDVELSANNGSSYTSLKTTPILTTSDTVYTLGDESDTWDHGWSVGETGDGSFLLRITGNPDTNEVKLDAVRVRIHHYLGGGNEGGPIEVRRPGLLPFAGAWYLSTSDVKNLNTLSAIVITNLNYALNLLEATLRKIDL